MDMVLVYLGIVIPQFVICAGIIQAVELLRDIRDELEGRDRF